MNRTKKNGYYLSFIHLNVQKTIVLYFQWSNVTQATVLDSDWSCPFLRHKRLLHRSDRCNFNKLLSPNLTLTAALCHKIHLLPL